MTITGPGATDSADERPLWLLDIDGVINALGTRIPTDTWPRDAWVQRLVPVDLPGHGRTTLPILAARPVLDFVDAGRRLVWTDDDVARYRDDAATGTAMAALADDGGTLVVPVDGRTGLTPADLAEIDGFLAPAP